MEDIKKYEFNARITGERYYNEDSNWGVFVFTTDEEIPHLQQSKDMFSEEIVPISTLCGKVQRLCIGAEYKITAEIEYNSKFSSYQYKPISAVACSPKNDRDKLIFLQTAVRDSVAKQLLERYPTIIEDIVSGKIKKEEFDTKGIKGLGSYTFNKMYDKIVDNYVISDIIVMLQPLGITYNMIKKLIIQEPNPSLLKQKLNENPYIVTSIRGIGFNKADALALKLKPELKESIQRLNAFVQHYLRKCGDDDGHTWVDLNSLKGEVSNNVPECYALFDECIKTNKHIHVETSGETVRVGMAYMYNVEKNIADIIINKEGVTHEKFLFKDDEIDSAIKKAEEKQGFVYTEEQINVIKNALEQNVSFISGGAGCGKTSIARGIMQMYSDRGMKITCVALSAKAAQRISEATGLPAMTIHRALGAIGFDKFTYNNDNKLPTDVIFVDEASMINAKLFYDLLQAVGEYTRIVVSGDHLQLPPIGYGNIFADILKRDDIFHCFKLTKVMRQAEKSGILSDATKIRKGKNPLEKPELKVVHGELNDMYYMFRDNRETLNRIAVNTFIKSIKTDGIDNVVIAVPRREGCLNSSFEINNEIQAVLMKDKEPIVDKKFIKFYKGDKVIQTTNNYEKKIFNGEVGYVKRNVSKTIDNECIDFIQVEFDDYSTGGKKIVEYENKELNQLNLAYALTVHKLQGDESKTVIGIVDNTHYALLDSCMLYTMITRAKNRCLLLCEPNAFIKCVRTNKNISRQTWLKDMKLEKSKQLYIEHY